MKKILKRALPLLLVVAMIFTLSAGAIAAIPIPTTGIFKKIEAKLAGCFSRSEEEKGVRGVLKELYNFSADYLEPGKAPTEPKQDDYETAEEYDKAVDEYNQEYAAYIAKYAGSVVGIAGSAIASGEVMLPTYIDVVLDESVNSWDILKVKKGTEKIEQGIELPLAAVEFAGFPDTYSFFGTKDVLGNDVYDPATGEKVTNPFIRIYNYDTDDVTITVFFVKETGEKLGMDYICNTYYIDGDLGIAQVMCKIMQNKSLYKLNDPINVKDDIEGIKGVIDKSAEKGVLSRLIQKINNKLSKKSFLEVLFGRN